MPSETSPPLPVPIVGSTEMLDLERLAPIFADRAAREFAERESLGAPLSRALKLISECFQVIAPIIVELDDWEADPNEWGLAIDVPVSGDPADVSRAHWNYALKARSALGRASERITVVCDIR